MNRQGRLADLFARKQIIPVLVIERISDAVPLARALLGGGLTTLEITMRTPVALDVVRAIRDEAPEALVGVGTVLTPADLDAAWNAGAAFAVSPGATDKLIGAAGPELPLLPGAASVSESMHLLEAGFPMQKFFPAEPSGGRAFLSALTSPLPQARFCPTGGVTAATAAAYLKLPNVFAVGGSWMVPAALIADHRWDEIRSLAAEAARTAASGVVS
jgi:2-dehydro-3-deoxyphosphogluconate aldolase / (4S)-4-hydroxy-2-oxoglutarate aldolase